MKMVSKVKIKIQWIFLSYTVILKVKLTLIILQYLKNFNGLLFNHKGRKSFILNTLLIFMFKYFYQI
ncbi:hypothetical protein ACM46_11235 [Chryseobacterium angstadtii]|uniref:Uncharacterized protein n=1 Tax=Chryseobacterium angstadtii TaxID=558151 RepID=A0A0J7L6W2_9FLAO|nr:hypothetical protein ACM46_11235 [Chryseobacterium angstadtii]